MQPEAQMMQLASSVYQVRYIECQGYLFQQVQPVGSGSFSTVYRGHKKDNPNYNVAVKVLKLPFNRIQQKELGYIIQEITTQRSIDPKCVVQILASGEAKVIQGRKKQLVSRYCIITQYMDQGTLEQVLEEDYNGCMKPEVALETMRKILQCYKGLYAKNIIHRDLKPQNIMVKNQNGKKIIKLADFGTSRFATGATRSTIIGTPNYQSPQQAKGISHQDSKCDVYSFGAIFFRLLASKPPKSCGCIDQVTWKTHQKKIEEILEGIEGMNKNIIDFICKCMEFQVQQRLSWQQIFMHPIFSQFKHILLTPNINYDRAHQSYKIDKVKVCTRTQQVYSYIISNQTLPSIGKYTYSIRPLKLDGKNNLRIGFSVYDSQKITKNIENQAASLTYWIKHRQIMGLNLQIEEQQHESKFFQKFVKKADDCLKDVPSLVTVSVDFHKHVIQWIYNGKSQCKLPLPINFEGKAIYAKVLLEQHQDSFQFI